MEKRNIKTLEQFKGQHYGRKGTKKRNALETGYEAFRKYQIIKLKD